MEFDDQMRRFFRTDDLGAVSPNAMASGIEQMHKCRREDARQSCTEIRS